MATHSSILAWRIPMDRGAWRATGQGSKESGTTEQLSATQSQAVFKVRCVAVSCSNRCILIPISQIREMRHSEIKLSAQVYPHVNGRGRNSDSPEPMFVTAVLYCFKQGDP